ncbi:aminoglycoside phosphotransferase family protein [Photobacterium gaetbulicola]|uniref:Aminoglycoside phosphotransferase domain-containing protein n=1 Tax=Photobacterium gaetbulicola Gung47 TaxID=658445 RepID=A0A0C5WEF6_9GAMM|nr:aminoglycoside phosphotransferase family protein [Photobacterium gaetbulicola]AJR05493.1 hypothetical protein H744_1c0468 [Photobacterium gaetbulicola Gung47]PST99766.1 aminoglycoside phosphotransferase family protein [Photobacterium gaetbulicola]
MNDKKIDDVNNIGEVLEGGRSGKIVKMNKDVRRPASEWTETVHKVLRLIRGNGFKKVPEPKALDGSGFETVSFIEGEVSNYPLSENARSENALITAAKLLREFHDASRKVLSALDDECCWMLPARKPIEVLCHGDYAPYNVVLNENEAIGIIDFDTLHPGPVIWDVCYAIYRWAPIKNPNNPDSIGDINEQITRAKIFCDAYGLDYESRKMIPSMMVDRLTALVNFMLDQAGEGDEDFESNLSEGHHIAYLNDIEYIKQHEEQIISGIVGGSL